MTIATGKSRKRSKIVQVTISLVPVILYLFMLSWIPLPESLASADITTTTLSRLVFLGIIILGLLAGFGAVDNAWAFFPLFMRHRYVVSFKKSVHAIDEASRTIATEGDLSTAQQSLARVREDLQNRRAAMQREQASRVRLWSFQKLVLTVRTQPHIEATWYSRVVPTFRSAFAHL